MINQITLFSFILDLPLPPCLSPLKNSCETVIFKLAVEPAQKKIK